MHALCRSTTAIAIAIAVVNRAFYCIVYIPTVHCVSIAASNFPQRSLDLYYMAIKLVYSNSCLFSAEFVTKG